MVDDIEEPVDDDVIETTDEPIVDASEEFTRETEETAVAPVEKPNYREKYGLSDLPEDDEEAIYRQLAETRRQAQQASQWQLLHQQTVAELNQERQRQQQAAAQQQQYAAYMQQQQQLAAQQPKWEAPEFDPSWTKFLTVDPDTKAIVAVPGADPSLPQKYEKYQQWQQQTQAEFYRNPAEFIQKQYGQQMEQRAAQIAQHVVQQYIGQMQQQAQQAKSVEFAKSFVSENATWLCQTDSAGKPIINPSTGAPVFNEFGQQFDQRVVQLERMVGIEEATRIAFKEFKADALEYDASQQAAGKQTVDANAAKKANFLKKGARSGAQPKPGQHVPKNGRFDIAQVMRERVAHLPDEDFQDH